MRAGGVTDIIVHNETGLLSTATGGLDAVEFCDNVITLAMNLKLRRAMGHAGREFTKRLSWEAVTHNLSSVYYPLSIKRHKERRLRNIPAEQLVLQELQNDETIFKK